MEGIPTRPSEGVTSGENLYMVGLVRMEGSVKEISVPYRRFLEVHEEYDRIFQTGQVISPAHEGRPAKKTGFGYDK